MKLKIIGVLFAAGIALAVASPAEAADHIANLSNDDAFWVLTALLIAGLAAGYGVRSFVSSVRHRRAVRYDRVTSGRWQP